MSRKKSMQARDNRYLKHYGMPRRSGRYPWGSGKNPQRNINTYNVYRQLHKEGFTDKEIAAQWGMSTTKLVALKAIGHKQERDIKVQRAEALKEKGYSVSEIGRRMGIPESSVRSLLDESKKERSTRLLETARVLGDFCDKHKYIDVGAGTEIALGVKSSMLKTSLEALKAEGYEVHNVKVPQLGTNHQTTVQCLVAPGVTYKELQAHKWDIIPVHDTVINGTLNLKQPGPLPVNNVDVNRVSIKFAEDGGVDRDGVIMVRRGCPDLDLGAASYAQVRIGVNGTHYCKGMCVYGKDSDFPPGCDIIVNSNKKRGTPVLGTGDDTVLKQQKSDPRNPFKASIKDEDDLRMVQKMYKDPVTGESKISALNIVNEEGDWDRWKKSLSSQFLSKQRVDLAKQQLGQKLAESEEEFETIKSLKNPTLKKILLEKFSENCDSAAVELRGAALPKQASKVLLPEPSLRENEVYAPHLDNGTRVVLIRFPHASTSEIPSLIVNNKNRNAIDMIGKHPTDAICINPKTAQQLSGADFDGDSVLVIPANNPGGKVKIKTQPQFKDLVGFDTGMYKIPADEPDREKKIISHSYMQKQMGIVSNLITDMTLQEAPEEHMVRAIKHSMVIIDSEKHELDWKKSKRENNIDELVHLYQRTINPETGEIHYGGASTIISKAKSKYVEPEVKDDNKLIPYHYSEQYGKWVGNVDTRTGERIKKYTGSTYTTLKVKTSDGKKKDMTVYDTKDGRHFTIDPFTKERVYHDQATIDEFGKIHGRTHETTKMEAAKDAFTLTSGGSREDPGHPMEGVYADYANKQKALGNKARLEAVSTPPAKVDKGAKIAYKKEYDEIATMIEKARANAPLERRAQRLGNKMVEEERIKDPYMDYDHLKKLKGRSIQDARKAVGANKFRIDDVTDRQWEAIERGAIPAAMQEELFNIVDMDHLKERAMPRAQKNTISEAKANRIKALSSSYTQAEIAKIMGISASQVSKVING